MSQRPFVPRSAMSFDPLFHILIVVLLGLTVIYLALRYSERRARARTDDLLKRAEAAGRGER